MVVDNAAGREMGKVLPVARLLLVLARFVCSYMDGYRSTTYSDLYMFADDECVTLTTE